MLCFQTCLECLFSDIIDKYNVPKAKFSGELASSLAAVYIPHEVLKHVLLAIELCPSCV